MKIVVWALAGLLTLGALGASGNVQQPIHLVISAGSPDELPAYDTLEEAGVHGIQRAIECSIYYECAGSIAQRPDGKFVVGPTGSDDHGDSVDVDHSVPPGWKLVADYHTHPCLNRTHLPDFFSAQDMAGSTMLKITGFMGDLCTGDVHEFTPGRDAPNDTEVRPDSGVYLSRGRIVGHVAVPNTVIEPNTGL